MKRFIALTLILIVLGAIKAEEAKETVQECKCAEGEENCPCLALGQEMKSASKNINPYSKFR